MIRLESINNEVFIAHDDIVIIGDEELSFIKAKALESPKHRARICVHENSKDPLHEMFIALSKQVYIRPHRHNQKSESFHIIEGEVDVVLFEDDGQIHKIISLGPVNTDHTFFYRLNSPRYHTLIVKSDMLVMHEVTNGPFDRKLAEFASFSPEEGEPEAVAKYSQQLAQQVAQLKVHKNER